MLPEIPTGSEKFSVLGEPPPAYVTVSAKFAVLPCAMLLLVDT